MLVFLQRWAREHDIRFLLFDPSKPVRSRLERAKSIAEFYIPSFEEMMALLGVCEQPIRAGGLSPLTSVHRSPRSLDSYARRSNPAVAISDLL
jgi:hypothetical protein